VIKARAMPYLKTKYSVQEVSDDTVLHLIVPVGHIVPCGPRLIKNGTYVVEWFDFTRRIRTTKYFRCIEQADAFKQSCLTEGNSNDGRRTVTVADVLKKQKYFEKFYRIYPLPIEYDARAVPIDPIFFGIWIGDGSSSACAVTTADKEILDYVTNVAKDYDMVMRSDGRYTYTICIPNAKASVSVSVEEGIRAVLEVLAGESLKAVSKRLQHSAITLAKYVSMYKSGILEEYLHNRRRNPIATALRDLGVWGNKHIPDIYLRNSRDVRLKVLAGIIDTDGHLSKGCGYDMCFKSKRLLDDIVTLVRSLGFVCADAQKVVRMCTNSRDGPKECEAYRTYISGGDNLQDIPMLLARKRLTGNKSQRYDQARFTLHQDDPRQSSEN
jgi:replicative DNA helicase